MEYMKFGPIFLVCMALLTASWVYIGYKHFDPDTRTVQKTKTVYVTKPYVLVDIRDYLIKKGVATAWLDHLNKVTADCFSTKILDDHRSIFSYCKLRQPLLEASP